MFTQVKNYIKIYFQKFLSYFVILFCFLLFPVFFLYASLDVYFEKNTENLKQTKLAEMNNSLEYLNKYSNNKKYFHFLLSKIAEYAQKSNNPTDYIKKSIDNLKEKYPNGFRFIVWDEEGKLIKEVSDKTGYTYALNKIYESLSEVTKAVRFNPSIKITNLESIKKNNNILNKFLGKLFIPENLKKPIYNAIDSGPLMVDVASDYSFIWYAVNKKISFLCFISNDVINDFSGLRKISTNLTYNSDIIYGFSTIPNYEIPASKFPSRYASDIAIALSTFENGGDNLFENNRAIVKMSMPQPNVRTFCFFPKKGDNWDIEYNRNTWFAILCCILLFVYCLLGYWYLYKRCFFSISRKLTALFLFANLVPVVVLGFITKIYIDNKKLSLKNEVTDKIERTIREFDLHYNYLFDAYSSKINNVANDISIKINNSIIEKPEINRLDYLYNEINPSYLYLIASSGEILLSKNSEKTNAFSLNFISSMGQSFLSYLNNKPIITNEKTMFHDIFKPESSEFYDTFIRKIGNIGEYFLGNNKLYFYFYTFGLKDKFNNNYILMIIWNIEAFQNMFLKEKVNLLYKSFPEVDFCIKSNLENNYYGSENLKAYLNSIIEKNLKNKDKIIGVEEINSSKYLFTCVNGTNLNNWSIMGVYPEQLINKKINFFIFQVVIGALVSSLLTIIIGHFLSMHFLNPIQNLGKAAIAIGERDFSYRVPIGDKDEFGHLNQVFNRVIEGLGDFEVAKIVQNSLFPGNNFKAGNCDIFARTVVMTTLGGDYYDCFKINEKYYGIIIGDVAGHGIPAGLLMAMAKSAVLAAPDEVKINPFALTERLHKMFFSIKNDKLKRMMTFQYFVLNIENGHFIYTNAGHSYPVIIDNNTKQARFLDYIATPLGIGPKCRCKNQEFDLEKGQSLVIYTDGIVEANNEKGEQYGYDRYLESLPKYYDENPETYYYNLYNKVYKQWSLKQDDDLTLIIINRNKYE